MAGILVFWKLPDGPRDAGWLEADEKALAAERLDGEEKQRLARERHSLGDVLKDRRILVFAFLYFTMVINVYGLSFWVGEIVDQIDGIGDVSKGFVTAIPYTVAIIGMIVIPRYSDRTGERKRVVSACLALAAAAAGIAMINSIGNIGGFAGPYLVGLVKDATDSTDGGLVVLTAILFVGSVVALRATHDKELELAPETRTGRFDRTQTTTEHVSTTR